MPETMEHLFFHCQVTSEFLHQFEGWFENNTNSNVYITEENYYFCNHDDDMLNTILIILKQYIFSVKCFNETLSLDSLLNRITEFISLEHFIAIQENRCTNFEKRWGRLL